MLAERGVVCGLCKVGVQRVREGSEVCLSSCSGQGIH